MNRQQRKSFLVFGPLFLCAVDCFLLMENEIYYFSKRLGMFGFCALIRFRWFAWLYIDYAWWVMFYFSSSWLCLPWNVSEQQWANKERICFVAIVHCGIYATFRLGLIHLEGKLSIFVWIYSTTWVSSWASFCILLLIWDVWYCFADI